MPAAEDQITRTTKGGPSGASTATSTSTSTSAASGVTVTAHGNPVARLQMTVGRYMLFGQVGAGGMGAVHLGRRVGPAGFSRLVAVKRMHPHLSKEREFIHAFLDEARIAARISHPNVVSINDVVMDGDEVLLVMEYIHGRSLSFLTYAERKRGRAVPPGVAAALALDILHGLQAAHDARDERGDLLGVIHRDVSPQNVLVGVDGVARLLDFGIAKALGRLQNTETGSLKGKLAYMAPERLSGGDDAITAAVDVYAAAMVIWEMLEGDRYWSSITDDTSLIAKVTSSPYRHLREPSLASIDAVLEQAMQRKPQDRFATCRDLSLAIEGTLDAASRDQVMEWVESVAGPELAESADVIAEIEQRSMPFPMPTSTPSGSAEVAAAPEEEKKEDAPQPPPTSSVVRPLAIAIAAVALVAAILLVATRSPESSTPTSSTSATTTPAPPVASPAASANIVHEPPAPPPSPTTTITAASAAPPSLPPPPPRAARATKPVITAAPPVTTAPPATTPKRPDDEAPLDRK